MGPESWFGGLDGQFGGTVAGDLRSRHLDRAWCCSGRVGRAGVGGKGGGMGVAAEPGFGNGGAHGSPENASCCQAAAETPWSQRISGGG